MIYPYPFSTQLHPDGTGWNDCYGSSLEAYLRAYGKFPASMSDEDALNYISVATRGTPDSPNNPYTTLAQADLGLAHWGLPVTLSYDWTKALNAPWSICLVDGTAITKADGTKPYPASWFNYETGPDHFCLWGPGYQGRFDWLMNPLDPAMQWAEYDLGSLQRAFSCAYLLPDVPGPAAIKKVSWMAKTKATLKPQPNHESTGICPVPAGASGVTWNETKQVGADLWIRVAFRASYGWLIKNNLNIATA